MSSGNDPHAVADYCCDTGEGPLWHAEEQSLFWTDIPTGRVFRYHPSSDQHEQVLNGRIVSGMTVQADGSLLVFGANGYIGNWSGGTVVTLIDRIESEVGTRFNDVETDPIGRVICGTMSSSTHPGRLYRYDLDGTLSVLIEGVGISNGIGFTSDHATMYFSESVPGIIHAFDYDVDSGSISNQRTFAAVSKEQGSPDGLIVDAEDYVWSARWDGNCIVRYAPDGSIDRTLAFPVPKVSSLKFGGPDLRDLYVTTAGGHQKNLDGELAGALFVVKNAGQGVPDVLSKIAPKK